MLQGKKSLRNLALLEVGISSSLRASDILRIRVSDVEALESEGSFLTREKKTQKIRRVAVSEKALRVLSAYKGERILRRIWDRKIVNYIIFPLFLGEVKGNFSIDRDIFKIINRF